MNPLRGSGPEFRRFQDKREGRINDHIIAVFKHETTYSYDSNGKSHTKKKKLNFKTSNADFLRVISGRRFYSPALGRWVNRDPIGEDGAVNLQIFCSNNIANLVDFLGLSEIPTDTKDASGPAIDVNQLIAAKKSTDSYLRVSLVDSTNVAFGMFYKELKVFSTSGTHLSVSFLEKELESDDYVLVNAYIKPKNTKIGDDDEIRPYAYSRLLPNGEKENRNSYNHVSWVNNNNIRVSQLWRESPPGHGYSGADMWTIDSMLRGKTPNINGVSYVATVYSVVLSACDIRAKNITGVEVFIHDLLNMTGVTQTGPPRVTSNWATLEP